MNKSKSHGYKLAKRFMNSKDIFKLLERLSKVGYGYKIVGTEKNEPYYAHGYLNQIILKYVGDDHKSILPIHIFYKDRQCKDSFKQDIQIRYFY